VLGIGYQLSVVGDRGLPGVGQRYHPVAIKNKNIDKDHDAVEHVQENDRIIVVIYFMQHPGNIAGEDNKEKYNAFTLI
jgi:hypothetical protein